LTGFFYFIIVEKRISSNLVLPLIHVSFAGKKKK
jgi:hypothetical protein